MKTKNQELWDRCVANNTDPYGKCCVDFTRAWAEEMEARLEAGATVADCAKAACTEVDNRPGMGITGYMYGCAVGMLAECWEHGEELRRWHNIDTQIGDEGERANERGTVLNPALLSIGKAAD